MRENFDWLMTLCLSTRCNRGCYHCLANADMEGKIFTIQNAIKLESEISKCKKNFLLDEDNFSARVEFTGRGEPLLNPFLVEIFDHIFSQKEVFGVLDTSGVNPSAINEIEAFKKILSKDYASRLEFFLSFSLFEERCLDRLAQTIFLLVEGGMERATIRVCHSARNKDQTRNVLSGLFGVFAKKMKVEFSDRICIEGLKIDFVSNSLIKKGRATMLSEDCFSNKDHLKKCFFLHSSDERELIHLGVDGGWYLCCECPAVDFMRVGWLGDDLEQVYQQLGVFRKELWGKIKDDSEFPFQQDFCAFCQKVAEKNFSI